MRREEARAVAVCDAMRRTGIGEWAPYDRAMTSRAEGEGTWSRRGQRAGSQTVLLRTWTWQHAIHCCGCSRDGTRDGMSVVVKEGIPVACEGP